MTVGTEPVEGFIPPLNPYEGGNSFFVVSVPEYFGRNAANNGIGWYIFRDYSSGKDDSAVAYCNTARQERARSNPTVVTDLYGGAKFLKSLFRGEGGHGLFA